MNQALEFRMPASPKYKIQLVQSGQCKPTVVLLTHRETKQSSKLYDIDLLAGSIPEFLDKAPWYVYAVVCNLFMMADPKGVTLTDQQAAFIEQLSK